MVSEGEDEVIKVANLVAKFENEIRKQDPNNRFIRSVRHVLRESRKVQRHPLQRGDSEEEYILPTDGKQDQDISACTDQTKCRNRLTQQNRLTQIREKCSEIITKNVRCKAKPPPPLYPRPKSISSPVLEPRTDKPTRKRKNKVMELQEVGVDDDFTVIDFKDCLGDSEACHIQEGSNVKKLHLQPLDLSNESRGSAESLDSGCDIVTPRALKSGPSIAEKQGYGPQHTTTYSDRNYFENVNKSCSNTDLSELSGSMVVSSDDKHCGDNQIKPDVNNESNESEQMGESTISCEIFICCETSIHPTKESPSKRENTPETVEPSSGIRGDCESSVCEYEFNLAKCKPNRDAKITELQFNRRLSVGQITSPAGRGIKTSAKTELYDFTVKEEDASSEEDDPVLGFLQIQDKFRLFEPNKAVTDDTSDYAQHLRSKLTKKISIAQHSIQPKCEQDKLMGFISPSENHSSDKEELLNTKDKTACVVHDDLEQFIVRCFNITTTVQKKLHTQTDEVLLRCFVPTTASLDIDLVEQDNLSSLSSTESLLWSDGEISELID